MQNARALWLVFGLTLLLCTSVACEQAGGDAVLGADLLAAEQEGITLGADPEQIVLDPNDPEAPRDPVTGKLIGKTSLGAFVRDADGEPQVGVEVTFSTTAGRLESEGQPVTTNERGLATDVLAVDEDDAGDVEITAVSGDFTQTLIVPVILVPLNTPPTADAGDDQTVECPTVTLDGSGSSDPDSTPGTNDDIVKFEWFVDETKIADGEMVEVELPVGTTVVTLTVTDRAGATDSDDTTVMLQDTTPPMVTLRMSPNELWPPNHKLHDIEAVLDIRDCDPSPTQQQRAGQRNRRR